ncbi:ABC transporter permease [Rhodopseudomonas palustris]|uniref:ABC transporter permease n=1 Tax=Rhodopseudomonas palustris TaxID=1076 RepID=UPI0022F133E0|nr:ABC transporter permease [Rhodopseudomonas palustris]WBU31187.1 ABC transporter permease [Rhodopseudomonas palustris]
MSGSAKLQFRAVQGEAAGRPIAAERQLSVWQRQFGRSWVYQAAFLLLLAAIWEGYGRFVDNPLLVPTLTQTLLAMWDGLVGGELTVRIVNSLRVLLTGYVIGVVLACLLTSLAVSNRFGRDALSVLTAMFNPLPAISLLPIALLWFGMGWGSLVFVIVHAVMWPMALNVHTGFEGISPTLRMAGQNAGLRGLRYVRHILLPAALPSIISGLKLGWAFAWRTLIASEMVFGVSSGSGGIGWFIFVNRNLMETANVFAGLLTVVLIGLLIESLIFRALENATVRRWGMVR